MKKRSWAEGEVGRGEHAARKVRKEIGFHHPTEAEIEILAQLRGATVRYAPLSGAQARLSKVGAGAIITVSSTIEYRPRQRFAVAHELGHLEAHRDSDRLDVCSERAISELYDQGTEREANAFASELLMPADLWRPRVEVRRPTFDIVKELREDFQVSFMAAAVRFVKLCPERCAVVFCQKGRTVWSARQDDFRHWIELRTPLDPYTLAHDYFKDGKVSSRQETVSASAWLSASDLDDDCDMQEQCCPIPSLNACISLLWIPSDQEY